MALIFKCVTRKKFSLVFCSDCWLLITFSLYSYPTLPMNPLPPNSLPKLSYDSPRYKLTPERAIALIKWFEEHKDHPYPTRHEKILLCQSTQLTFTQVSRDKWGWWGGEGCREGVRETWIECVYAQPRPILTNCDLPLATSGHPVIVIRLMTTLLCSYTWQLSRYKNIPV